MQLNLKPNTAPALEAMFKKFAVESWALTVLAILPCVLRTSTCEAKAVGLRNFYLAICYVITLSELEWSSQRHPRPMVSAVTMSPLPRCLTALSSSRQATTFGYVALDLKCHQLMP